MPRLNVFEKWASPWATTSKRVGSTVHPAINTKHAALKQRLRELEPVLVAFSGGVDSTTLLKVAVTALGRNGVLAVTGRSPSMPRDELEAASRLAAQVGAKHEFIDTHEFNDERYLANTIDRCYICKTELYGRLKELAAERGLKTVIDGANADDLADYRPGMKAAAEYLVHSPLADCGLTKSELRKLAAALGLSVHDKPASPCLSTRLPYGEQITLEKLGRIDAAEVFLHEQGFRECRVRHHEDLARIEVPADKIFRFADPAFRTKVERKLRELGYRYVTLDLRGFRSGSMNESLAEKNPGAGR